MAQASVREGAVQRLKDAVDVRQVILFDLCHGVRHVETAHADDRRLQGMEGAFADPGCDFAADAAERGGLVGHDQAARLGDAGYDRARLVTWDGVIEKLIGAGA